MLGHAAKEQTRQPLPMALWLGGTFCGWGRFPWLGYFPMADKPNRPEAMDGSVVQRLVKETGITEAQARELVSVLGFHWASLMREARFLKQKL